MVGAHRQQRWQLDALQRAMERCAKRLRRQLLEAARVDNEEQIPHVADAAQAEPLLEDAADDAFEQRSGSSAHDADDEDDVPAENSFVDPRREPRR